VRVRADRTSVAVAVDGARVCRSGVLLRRVWRSCGCAGPRPPCRNKGRMAEIPGAGWSSPRWSRRVAVVKSGGCRWVVDVGFHSGQAAKHSYAGWTSANNHGDHRGRKDALRDVRRARTRCCKEVNRRYREGFRRWNAAATEKARTVHLRLIPSQEEAGAYTSLRVTHQFWPTPGSPPRSGHSRRPHWDKRTDGSHNRKLCTKTELIKHATWRSLSQVVELDTAEWIDWIQQQSLQFSERGHRPPPNTNDCSYANTPPILATQTLSQSLRDSTRPGAVPAPSHDLAFL